MVPTRWPWRRARTSMAMSMFLMALSAGSAMPPIADVTIIWARDDEGNVGGFLVEKGTPGFEPKVMTGKVSKRAVWQADITLTDVHVPVENRLALSHSFKDTALVLTATRSGVAWEAVGHAMAAYEIALTYAKERVQFGKPLVSFQIIQNKLATMLANVTAMQLLCLRLGQLQAAEQDDRGYGFAGKDEQCSTGPRGRRRCARDARRQWHSAGVPHRSPPCRY